MLPRSGIEAMDQPTVLYILYSMITAQEMNLLPNTLASQNDVIF